MVYKMTEEQLHSQICTYLKAQYPKILFNSDMAGVRLTIGQAKKVKKLRSSNAYPDIVIYEKSNIRKDLGALIQKYCYDEIFFALFLEVKKETPYRKNGKLKKQTAYEIINGKKIKYDHLQRQNEMHEKLRQREYIAEFVWSFDMAKKIIDNYLK